MEELYVIDKKVDENVIREYLKDTFFYELEDFIKTEDYALAKDATKGLYNLAGELALYDLYQLLIDIYEDLEYEEYNELLNHYQAMMIEYHRLFDLYNGENK